MLEELANDDVMLLHQRRIAGAESTTDHVVISAGGLYLINIMRYRELPHLLVAGDFIAAGNSTLVIGGRDCTRLLHEAQQQVAAARNALAADDRWDGVAVHCMLCVPDTVRPAFVSSFSIDGLDLLGPAKALDRVRNPGPLDNDAIAGVYRYLATAAAVA
jgi:hypothetical protein